MSSNLQAALTNLLGNLSSASSSEQAWSVIYVTMLSPEFAIQR
jgi:hypothetical protein